MPQCFLSLGSNLGNKRENINRALALMVERVGDVSRRSEFHETEPWGFESESKFLNLALEIETKLQPYDLLRATSRIEKEVGRKEKSVNGKYKDRIIDIDILFYDDEIIESPDLTIPHPLLHKRSFVVQPLAEIAPDFVHPALKKKIRELL
jgi:2-amino-4-hydroxy-6-hydroxymethyldihydropteridine diphosphokinase